MDDASVGAHSCAPLPADRASPAPPAIADFACQISLERCALFEQAKAPMAHIQHLGSYLLDCGAQPRFLPGPTALRALTVQLGCGRAAKAPARLAHSKTSLASTACGPEP